MAYTALQLITKAFYLSQIVTQDYFKATSDQIIEGLECLNDLFAEKTIDAALNPYYQSYELIVDPNTEMYFIPNLIGATSVTFTLNSVRYSVQKMGRAQYFGAARANNIPSLPFQWHLEKCKGGSNLFIYFLPNEAYDFEIWGQFSLQSDVTLYQDLSLTFDRFYLSYLKFLLAKRLCAYYAEPVPMAVERQLDEFDETMGLQISASDLKMQKISTLDGASTLNYGFVNLSPNGWFPSGII